MSAQATKTQPAPDDADPTTRVADGNASRLLRVLDAYLSALQAGQQPDRARLLAEHPELARELESCLAGLEFIHRASTATECPQRIGDFELLEEIGRGGMGVVYKALQMSLKRLVALKVLRLGVGPDDEAMRRFQVEAETVARLHHTNIVPIFAAGSEHGVHYYAMQYIEGQTLAEHLNGQTPEKELAGWGLQAAEALAFAHQRGVIHRDVKPSNLILDRQGTLWLTDFGLAKRSEDATLTEAGAMLGTPRYMSPEQATVLEQPVDQRTDIYSLGASLYELATGQPVYSARTTHGVLVQIIHSEPSAPRSLRPGLSRDLETIILKCLAKQPDARYDSAQALARDLRALLDGHPITARRPSICRRALRWLHKQRRSAALVAATAFLVLLSLFGVRQAWQSHSRSQLGWLELQSDQQDLQAVILSEQERRVLVPTFLLPTPGPIPLVAGAYRVRVACPGRLSQTFDLQLRPGEAARYALALEESRLWEIPAHGFYPNDKLLLRAAEDELWRLEPGVVTGFDLQTGEERWRREAPGAADGMFTVPDLDGDGETDLLWTGVGGGEILATSGKHGFAPIWRSKGLPGAVSDAPLLCSLDGEAGPVFIVQQSRRRDVWLVALSGADGRQLWRHEVWNSPEMAHSHPPVTDLAGDSSVVLGTVGSELYALDTHRGLLRVSAALAGEAVQAPQLLDLDADGEPEALVLSRDDDGHGHLEVFSLSSGDRLHHARLGRYEPDGAGLPSAVDLEGDGVCELLFVQQGPGTELRVEVRGGLADTVRWSRELADPTAALIQRGFSGALVLAGPDLDADGCREVLVAYAGQGAGDPATSLIVLALSGCDGAPLWEWAGCLDARDLRGTSDIPSGQAAAEPGRDRAGARVTRSQWWTWSPGQPPLLALTVELAGRQQLAFLALAPHGAELRSVLAGCIDVQCRDLTGDGAEELLFWREQPGTDRKGALCALRAPEPRLWSRLGHYGPTAPSADGGGLLWDGPQAVRSESGRVPWLGPAPSAEPDLAVLASLTPGDPEAPVIVADLVRRGDSERARLRLKAIAPGSGELLWASQEPSGATQDGTWAAITLLEVAPDHRSILVCVDKEQSHWLARFDAGDGRLQWRQELPVPRHGPRLAPVCGDLDGDAFPDLIVAVAAAGRPGLLAHRGSDGGPLWQRLFRDSPDGQIVLETVDDALPPYLLLSEARDEGLRTRHSVTACSGRDGSTLWSVDLPVASSLAIAPPVRVGALGEARLAVCFPLVAGMALTALNLAGEIGRARLLSEEVEPGDSLSVSVSATQSPRKIHTRGLDLDGDGARELLVCLEGDVLAFDAGLDLLWRYATPGDAARTLGIAPGADGNQPVLVLRVGDEVVGLHASSGEPRFRRHGQAWLSGPGMGLVIDQQQDATICRPAEPDPQSWAGGSTRRGPARRLPWVSPYAASQGSPTVLGLPPTVLSLVAAGVLLGLALTRRWRLFALFPGAVLASSLLLGGVWLAMDGQLLHETPGYTWQGGFSIGWWGLCAADALFLAGLCGAAVVRAARGKIPRAHQPAPRITLEPAR